MATIAPRYTLCVIPPRDQDRASPPEHWSEAELLAEGYAANPCLASSNADAAAQVSAVGTSLNWLPICDSPSASAVTRRNAIRLLFVDRDERRAMLAP